MDAVGSLQRPVRLGVAGLGGFGGCIVDRLTPGGPAAGAGLEIAATCEPFTSPEVDKRKAEMQAMGGPVVDSFERLLQLDIDAVWLPLPIDLHRPFTERALAAGKAVMCEKPAAGCVDDLDAMIAARNASGLPVAIGFQHVYDPGNLALKRRILAGAIGRPTHATLHACWPRPESYYTRAAWAGALKRNGVWVLDSPASNALAHYINLALFLLGPTDVESADFTAVEAELYRAHDIENYDTISLRLALDGGCTFLALLTHACEKTVHPIISIQGERGSLRWDLNTASSTLCVGGREAETKPVLWSPYREGAVRCARLVRRQDDPSRAAATLETARAHLAAVNVASEAATVVQIPASGVRAVDNEQGRLRVATGIEDVFADAAEKRLMLNETGRYPWTVTPGKLTVRGREYRHFAGPPAAPPAPRR